MRIAAVILFAGSVALAQSAEPDQNAVAEAIKADFESVVGPGSVIVDRASGRLFNVRIEVPTLSSEFCNPIYDREIKLYRLFPELNFDFYIRLRDPR